MGLNQKLRKQQRLEQIEAEKLAALERRAQRVKPVKKVTKKVLAALLATIILLVVGMVINNRLDAIAQRMHH